MRAVIQRVSRASVIINHDIKRSIGEGLLVLLGIEEADGAADIRLLEGKDREILSYAILFDLYHRYSPAIDELIQDERGVRIAREEGD